MSPDRIHLSPALHALAELCGIGAFHCRPGGQSPVVDVTDHPAQAAAIRSQLVGVVERRWSHGPIWYQSWTGTLAGDWAVELVELVGACWPSDEPAAEPAGHPGWESGSCTTTPESAGQLVPAQWPLAQHPHARRPAARGGLFRSHTVRADLTPPTE